jgi:hypothetical protein
MLCLAVEPWKSVPGTPGRDTDLKGTHSLPTPTVLSTTGAAFFQTAPDTRHFPWCTGTGTGGKNETGLRGRYTFRLNALPTP